MQAINLLVTVIKSLGFKTTTYVVYYTRRKVKKNLNSVRARITLTHTMVNELDLSNGSPSQRPPKYYNNYSSFFFWPYCFVIYFYQDFFDALKNYTISIFYF